MEGVKSPRGSDHIRRTIDDVVNLETVDRTLSERIAERVAALTGSLTFVWVHAAWFAVWILFNLPWWGFEPFDPYPFTFLTMIVSLEAIFLSTFILITENRPSRLADRRARVNLEIDMISEHEITKLIQLTREMHDHFGIGRHDQELDNMQQFYKCRISIPGRGLS